MIGSARFQEPGNMQIKVYVPKVIEIPSEYLPALAKRAADCLGGRAHDVSATRGHLVRQAVQPENTVAWLYRVVRNGNTAAPVYQTAELPRHKEAVERLIRAWPAAEAAAARAAGSVSPRLWNDSVASEYAAAAATRAGSISMRGKASRSTGAPASFFQARRRMRRCSGSPARRTALTRAITVTPYWPVKALAGQEV